VSGKKVKKGGDICTDEDWRKYTDSESEREKEGDRESVREGGRQST